MVAEASWQNGEKHRIIARIVKDTRLVSDGSDNPTRPLCRGHLSGYYPGSRRDCEWGDALGLAA